MQSYSNDDGMKRRHDTPPALSREQQLEILSLAIQGETIKYITSKVGISYETLARLIVRDPLFEREWRAARIASADLLADTLLEATDSAETAADAMIAKVKSDNIRTRVGWLNPKKYSPKTQVEVSHTVDLSGALSQADQRIAEFNETLKIEQTGKPSLDGLNKRVVDSYHARQEAYTLMDVAAAKAINDISKDIELPPLTPYIDPRDNGTATPAKSRYKDTQAIVNEARHNLKNQESAVIEAELVEQHVLTPTHDDQA